MDTKELNITIECGADFLLAFVVRNSADALVDLSGATVTAQVREYAEAVDYYQMTAVHNGQGGKVTLGMTYEDTAAISFSRGVYDVFIDFPNDTREKYLQGSVTVIPSVTKPVDGTVVYLLSFSSEDAFPVAGLVNRVYFSHASGKMYRWNGTGYVGIVRDGDAATVEVGTVTTLDPDQEAYVENVGSLTNAVFNFGIPKGDKGDDIGSEPDWDDIRNKPETFPPEDHDHDDRYYTEEEVDTMLGMKADAADLGDLAEKDMADWDTDIDNIPEAFPPETHDHDDRYYTELETDALLADKVDDDDLGSMAYEDDAPSDGKQYARKDGDWEEVTEPVWGQITGTLSDQTDLQDALDNKADVIVNSASGAIVSIPDAKASPVVGLSVGIEPVQSGSGDPSPDNVRPISGHTSATVTKTGKNLLEPKFYGGLDYNVAVGSKLVTTLTDITNTVSHTGNTYSKSGSSWNIVMNMMLPLNESFVGKRLKFSGSVAPITGYRSAYYVTDKDYIVKRKSNSMNEQPTWSVDIEQGDAFLFWFMNSSNAGTMVVTEPQIELGSTASTYEPYTGTTIPVTWETEAGTIYGGDLTLNEDGSADLTGVDELITLWI